MLCACVLKETVSDNDEILSIKGLQVSFYQMLTFFYTQKLTGRYYAMFLTLSVSPL